MKLLFWLLTILFFNQSLLCSGQNYKLSSLKGSSLINYNPNLVLYNPKLDRIFKKTYDYFWNTINTKKVNNSIPKIIHFIWLGGPMPSIYNFCIESWKRHHPKWQVMIWDDAKANSFNFRNKKIFNFVSNYGAKADILRLEILDRFGGLYVDIDFFCLKPIDFYTDQTSLLLGKAVGSNVGNGLIGACKNNKFIKHAIKAISDQFGSKINLNQKIDLSASEIVNFFGPNLITSQLEIYLKNSKNWQNTLILPQSYLHSFPTELRQDFWSYQISLLDIFKEYIYPETIAVHLWSISWLNKMNDPFFSSKNLAKKDVLIDLVINNQSKLVESLLRNGYNPNICDKKGKTPLYYAVKNQNFELARLLILFGADASSLKNTISSDKLDLILNRHQKQKIVIITCSYNNKAYYKQNLLSVFKQNYDNWEMYYIDDHSQDGTAGLVDQLVRQLGMEQKVHIIKNKQNIGAMANLYQTINKLNDRDIVLILDGDDYLYDNGVLAYINDIYHDPQVWLTYGSYVPLHKPFPVFCADVSLESNQNAEDFFRKHEWVFSHLRTFYAGLFKKINKKDLLLNQNFFTVCYDLAMMLPMLEMCNGQTKHYKYLSKNLYIYNNNSPINDFRIKSLEVSKVDQYIRSKKPYKPITKLF